MSVSWRFLYHGSVALLLAPWVSGARPESVRALRREGTGIDTKCPGGYEQKLPTYPLGLSAASLVSETDSPGDDIEEMLAPPYYCNDTNCYDDTTVIPDSTPSTRRRGVPPDSVRDPSDGKDKWTYLYAGAKGDTECHMGPPIKNQGECKRIAKFVWENKKWRRLVTITRKDLANRTRYPLGCSMKGKKLFFNKYNSGENTAITRPVCAFNLQPDANVARNMVQYIRKNYDNVPRESLKLSPQLSQAAWAHARDMSKRDYFSHEAPAPAPFGTIPYQRAWYFMHPGPAWGENIAGSYADHESALAGWMKRTGHRENILKPGYNSFGYAFYDRCLFSGRKGQKVYVQTFGNTW